MTLLPALLFSGLMLGALGMFLSSAIKQLENFAGVMNFVIFPMFFASSALYPLWKIEETSEWLYYVCLYNPFTYAVEILRFSLFISIIGSWVAPTSNNPFLSICHNITQPLLKPFQRLTSFGGIDFSPIIVFFLLIQIDRILDNLRFSMNLPILF